MAGTPKGTRNGVHVVLSELPRRPGPGVQVSTQTWKRAVLHRTEWRQLPRSRPAGSFYLQDLLILPPGTGLALRLPRVFFRIYFRL